VSAAHALPAEVRLYDRLFRVPDPEDLPEGGAVVDNLNPESLVVLRDARVEPSVASDDPATRYQFERTGYFWRDPVDGVGDTLVFNRIVTLKDAWSRRGASGADEASRAKADGVGKSKGKAPAGRDTGGESTPDGGRRVSEDRAGARRADPELTARMDRYVTELGLSAEDADVLTGERDFSDFFETALAEHGLAASVAAWVVNDVRGLLGGRGVGVLPFGGAELGRLARLVDEGTVSRRGAKDVLVELAENGGDPAAIVARMGLENVTDAGALAPIIDQVLAAWPEKVAEYRAGKVSLLGLFVGEVMKATRGAADPKTTKALLTERLSGDA
jgi:glutaminyl-tRNA synthetase